jgi:hypothetical protein
MLALQDKMNAKVNPQWRTAGYPWLRAVMIEGAEAMEHWGWKWWKKQEPNAGQFGIELVDIWHFILSHLLVTTPDPAAAIALELQSPTNIVSFDGDAYRIDEMSMNAMLDLLVGMAGAGRLSLSLFFVIMDAAGMTFNDLHVGYVSKNVLNFFRQDQGYKNGTYIKNWGGEEDNVRLFEIVATMDTSSPTFETDLYLRLATDYSGVLMVNGRVTEAQRLAENTANKLIVHA